MATVHANTPQHPKDLDTPLSNSFASKNPETTQYYYDQWAASYDSDVATHDYNGPKYLVQLCNKYVKKDGLMLCIGAGTGLEGEVLHRAGFTRLHGHDGSEKMLKIAEKRGVFEECIFELMQPNAESKFRTAHYDSMVCVGCFVPGGLDERYVEDMLRTLKPGGIGVLGTRERNSHELNWNSIIMSFSHIQVFVTDPGEPYNYHYNLDAKMTALHQSGKAELLERARFERYSENMPGMFYVVRKP